MSVALQTLVLNGEWRPINITSAYKAMSKVFASRAVCLNPKTFETYAWEEWVNEWEDVRNASGIGYERTVLPEVIVCTHYKGMGYGHKDKGIPKFSRSNLFLRDKNQCQFCSRFLPSSDLTMGHIIPKSKGGETSWSNIVLQCVSCNQKMADRTPEQAGMSLIRPVSIPSGKDLKLSPENRLRRKCSALSPRVWEQFLGNSDGDSDTDKVASFMYWNSEIKN